MLISGSKLLNFPVLSLHVGGAIARTAEAVVDPNNLHILGYTVVGPMVDAEVGDVLDIKSVREVANIGLIIDSSDELTTRDEVIKIGEILKLNFQLAGLTVETKKGTRLGKVADYVVNTDNFMVQQLVVKRPALKALTDPELIVGRSQIVEITDYKVIVKDEEAKIRREMIKKDFVPNFVNPFREPNFAPIQNQNPDEPGTE